ncbi:sigma-E factor negative regulatory protein [Ferrimonas marina]|uniref:Anti-sigma-E factor RseA n=1 Tax=Ferrimonas marina TaxID=299255 RepID=A0A1M5ZG91_9GAMM|nr:RseA family anti-sigma factor [Ferrimonas marina]SHI23276.1 sigma-E factor negative regulatory protein RseA [Ferrimonas marina]
MATDRKEQVSAWMDGQGPDEVLDQIGSDPELAQRWHRYHLIGDAMRNELPQTLQLDIADKVAAQLEQEPTVLAPKTPRKRFAMPAKVVELGQRFGQYAIAASVAAVAVVGVQQYDAAGGDLDSPIPVLQTTPLLGAPSPVSYQAPDYVQNDQRLAEQDAKEQQLRANAFLRDHLLQQRLNGVAVEQRDR